MPVDNDVRNVVYALFATIIEAAIVSAPVSVEFIASFATFNAADATPAAAANLPNLPTKSPKPPSKSFAFPLPSPISLFTCFNWVLVCSSCVCADFNEAEIDLPKSELFAVSFRFAHCIFNSFICAVSAFSACAVDKEPLFTFSSCLITR